MTITQECNYVTTDARKDAVKLTIDQTGRRQAIEANKDQLRKNAQHAWLQKIRTDTLIPDIEKDAILEAEIRDRAIRQQYGIDEEFAHAVNDILAVLGRP
jgi:hypothetical protein